MVSKAEGTNVSHNVLYDISCILHRHLQVNAWEYAALVSDRLTCS